MIARAVAGVIVVLGLWLVVVVAPPAGARLCDQASALPWLRCDGSVPNR